MPTRREALKAPAGLAWQSTTPGPRAGHALAYHAGLNATCLIGGDAPDGPDTRVWLWNGSTWTQRAQKDTPPATSLVAAVSDLDRRSILTFGRFPILARNRYGSPTGELWELSANGTWRKRDATGPQPGPRHHHAAAFDSVGGRLVLYGGIDDRDHWSTAVWEWDRQRWHRIETTNGPGERAHHAMAFDTTQSHHLARRNAIQPRPADGHLGMGGDLWDGTRARGNDARTARTKRPRARLRPGPQTRHALRQHLGMGRRPVARDAPALSDVGLGCAPLL
jgi:hypothetical protein